jgi:hypothetical protein
MNKYNEYKKYTEAVTFNRATQADKMTKQG